MITYEPCGDRFDELVQFAARLNTDGEHHIGFFGEGEADVRSSLLECVVPPSECFVMAYDGDRLVGVFGVDVNPEIHRAWLFGPLVEHAEWHAIADGLYEKVLPLVPGDIDHYDLYADERNVCLAEFARRHGFPMLSQTATLSLSRQDYRSPARTTMQIIPFEKGFFEAFDNLHALVFPNTYYTAQQIVDKLGPSRRLFLAVKDERLLGYIFCKTDEVGYIDFIGVDESARGRGIGAALLASGVEWMFSTPTVSVVHLTVQADNGVARALYTRCGFITERVMVGYRKQLHQENK